MTPRPPRPRVQDLRLHFVGDVIFGRYRAAGYDPITRGENTPFAHVRELLQGTGPRPLLVANLETPLVQTLPIWRRPKEVAYRFAADPRQAQALVDAGFVAVSLANNHAYDMGLQGLLQTPQILSRLGIKGLGAARFVPTAEPPRQPRRRLPPNTQAVRVETLIHDGVRVGFVALSVQHVPWHRGHPLVPYVPVGDVARVVAPHLARARSTHDVLVVLPHWGLEYAPTPDASQRHAARAMIDAGADLVIGHHPHVLQGFESYRGRVIAYSLGNFLFENTQPIPRLTGVLQVRVRLDGRVLCLPETRFVPAVVRKLPTGKAPLPASGQSAREVQARVQSQSLRLGLRWRQQGQALLYEQRCHTTLARAR